MGSVGTAVFAQTNYGLFLSTDSGATWVLDTTGMGYQNIHSFVNNGSNFFASSDQGVFITTDTGATWSSVNTGLTGLAVTSLAAKDNFLFATTSMGVFISADDGANWMEFNTGLTELNVNTIAASATDIYTATSHTGVWKRSLNDATALGINGVSNSKSDFDFIIYPDPAKNNFKVSIDNDFITPNTKLEMYNSSGYKVLEERMDKALPKEIMLKNFSAGIYFVRVNNGKQAFTRKLIVQ